MSTAAAGHAKVVITGGGGRLGSAIARQLAGAGASVTLVDIAFPDWLYDPASGIRRVEADVLSARAPRELRRIFSGHRTVVHLAGLHGLHLRWGARSADLWRSNVIGTRNVAEAAVHAGLRRLVLASTTAVYGPGSPEGSPATVLDERVRPNPDNPYATSKLAAESVATSAGGDSVEVVALRFGRFYRQDERDYQIRKLSTGLDLMDAVAAVAAVCEAEESAAAPVYCVASDLPLTRDDRARLGDDCHAVLEQHLPGFVAAARERGWDIPSRVGRSVDSSLLQATTGYRPTRSLAAVHEQWRAAAVGVNGTRRP
ncbi:NAD-dependent epimerase/dehydratase family protein [Saccharothrix deserti]|uniref:NAD-dependent epimerase/dehydratase family protein n=1 Tax=Saccharothrix deserti TaxID=2593674 RepID=UPI00131B9C85|nr:NAD(P)-dependent oxidoreductase [Saccharothrix deserti]